VLLARFGFQACSFNHSDISPSLKSRTCERSKQIIAHAGNLAAFSSISFALNGFDRCDDRRARKLCQMS